MNIYSCLFVSVRNKNGNRPCVVYHSLLSNYLAPSAETKLHSIRLFFDLLPYKHKFEVSLRSQVNPSTLLSPNSCSACDLSVTRNEPRNRF